MMGRWRHRQDETGSTGKDDPFPGTPEEQRERVLDLLGGLVGAKSMPATTTAKVPATEPAWRWLQSNASPEEAKRAMAFVGWLMRTGTRDQHALLALVKDFVVHRPRVPHAYYTPRGTARQSIVMRTHADRAIAEHERVKAEERAFLGGKGA